MRCSSGAAVDRCRFGPCSCGSAPGGGARVLACMCTRICFATPLPPICSSPAATCAECRNYWATPTSAPRRSIHIWISNIWPRCTRPRIRGRGAGSAALERAAGGPTLLPMIHHPDRIYGTTILAVRRNGHVAVGGDGQVTLGQSVMKGNARKVRRLYGDKVLAGFAGGTADAFTLFERFEGKLEKFGNLTRAAIELAKDWRTDRSLRRLEALLCVADTEKIFVISGNGDVIEPEYEVAAIGSGGQFAQAAARELVENTELDARSIVERALNIAAEICIYTNRNLVIDELS